MLDQLLEGRFAELLNNPLYHLNVVVVGCLGLLMLQKDLGTALLYFFTTLLLFYASTSNLPLTLLGLVRHCT